MTLRYPDIAAGKPGNIYFEQAFNEYCTELTSKPNKKRFIGEIELSNGNASAEELQEAVETLVKQCENKKLRQFWRKYLTPVVNGLDELSGMIGGTVQVVSNIPQAMPLAIVWGGLKFMMGWAQRFNSVFEQIQSELESLSEHLFRLSSCEKIYSVTPYSAPSVQRILAKSYKTILLFWYRVTKELRRKSIGQLVRSLFPSDKLKKVLDQLKEDADALERTCNVAEKELQTNSREIVRGIETELTAERIEAAIERAAAIEERKLNDARWCSLDEQQKRQVQHLEELIERQEHVRISIENENAARLRHERENRRRLAIRSIRGDASRSNDLLRGMIKERHPSTCEWLFKSPEFHTWIAIETNTPIFWLNGRHGAGKSFMCAAAVQRVRQDAESQPVAIQFLKKGMEISQLHILHNLAYQLTKSLESAIGDVPDTIISLIEDCKDDTGVIEILIPALFAELDRTFIFIDGLDEASDWKEIQDLVHFLIREATRAHGNIRLWFSSQPLPQIESYFRRDHGDNVLERVMHITDTEADIKSYFASAIPESVSEGNEFAQFLVQTSLETEVEGSFLWASSMISDLREKAEDTDDMIRLAQRRLPTRMDEIYRSIIDEYRSQDRTRRLLHSDLPLWKIILSLLTYTKRPLRLLELREAVAMLRSSTGEDLSTSKFVTLSNIRKECSRLVRFIQAEDSDEDGTLELNHSAVFAFLQEDADVSELDLRGRVVLPNLVCDLCVKYLSQPRYSRLLQRKTHHEFITQWGEDISSHQLLLYAAKYWYRHCDERTTSVESRQYLRQFLHSPNFCTLIQIQSVSIIGHFLLSFHRITGQPTRMKKILPACIRDGSDDTVQINSQFNEFLYEWSELLQFGLTSEFNGEIDRCFWQALGPSHFLRNGEGRYDSFHFVSPETSTAYNVAAQRYCFFHASALDGRELMLCRAQSGRECESGVLEVSIERWRIDGKGPALLAETESVTMSCVDVKWSLYSTPCSRQFPLIPQSTSVINPGGVAFLDGGRGLRIGSLVILRKDGSRGWRYIQAASLGVQTPQTDSGLGTPSESMIPKSDTSGTDVSDVPKSAVMLEEYCEEITHRSHLLVVCRRRIPKPDSSTTEPKLSGKRRTRRRRKAFYDSGDESSNESQDSDHQDNAEAPTFSDKSSLKSIPSSDDLRVASSNSGSSDEMDESEDADCGSVSNDSDSDGFDQVLDSDSSTDGSHSVSSLGYAEENITDESDKSSLLSAPTSESSNDEAHDILEEGQESLELNGDYKYPVGITSQTVYGGRNCDRCGQFETQSWYHCPLCLRDFSTFDVCHQCIKNGQWCDDKKHQLYEEVESVGVVSMISWKDFVLGQELLVFDTTSTTNTPMFHHSMSESTTLHQSAPAIHPKLSLVAWPVCAETILFVEISNPNKGKSRGFSRQSFRTTSKKARQISIDLFFSSCGTYLHVGSVEATKHKTNSVLHAWSNIHEKHYDLAFHVTTMKLSSTHPAKARPTIISRQCHALGVWTKPFVSNLPYTWTWTPAAAYFTMTGFKLRVYRIPLFPRDSGSRVKSTTEPSCCTPALITTPSETIILPRSCGERSVQFFPPPGTSDTISTVIIGPRYCPKPSPPIGVCLSEETLGPWINVHDKEGEERMRRPRRRFTGAFEEFDEDDDCDIIPFDDGR